VGTKDRECTQGMRQTSRRPTRLALRLGTGLIVVWTWLSASALAQTGATPLAPEAEAGKQLYMARCQHCHGENGDGKGASAAVVYPKPRDFTSGIYKFRTHHETADGNKMAGDEDIFRSINDGLHATSMPGWGGFYNKQQIGQLVAYIKTFASVFQEDKPGAALDFSGEIPSSPASIAKGKEHFEKTFECYTCHGIAGRGNGQQALDGLKDDWGERIWPANLTKPWTYRGGASRRDIFRNIALGITGTPMPAFADPDPMAAARVETDPQRKKDSETLAREVRENIWHTVNYVQSLWTYPVEPEAKSTLTATLVDEPLPTSPDAPVWKKAPINYYPLVGQVIEEPRLFTPMIVGVEIQALHNGKEIAFRVVWDDRTDSKPEGSGSTETFTDAMALQFPAKPLEGSERPYFLMGDSKRPTDLWYWRNDSPDKAVLVQTTGSKSFQLGDNPGGLRAQGVVDNGQYRVVLQRTLRTKNAGQEVQFAVGQFLPFNITTWDGSNGEVGGGKRTVMAWYNLYLEPEPSKAPMYLLGIGIVVGVILECSAYYVTRQSQNQNNTVTETGRS
jgi:DMSO reductase family type II enzyme heme b subunit